MIFIAGPGRSGTSALAKALHESGVSMGRRFREADEQNSEGYWEDLDFKELNEHLLRGRVRVDDWRYEVSKIASCRSEPWGLKDPRLCYLLGLYVEMFPEARVLRARRSVTKIAESMHKAYGWPFGEAIAEAAQRERMLDLLCPPETEILDFNRRWTEEELRAHVEAYQVPA